jgi:hypothetical protein
MRPAIDWNQYPKSDSKSYCVDVDDCRLAFRKADRALDRITTVLFAKGR